MRAEFRALCFANAAVTLKRTKVQQLPRRPSGSLESESKSEGEREGGRAATAQTGQTTAVATGGRASAGGRRRRGRASEEAGPV